MPLKTRQQVVQYKGRGEHNS